MAEPPQPTRLADPVWAEPYPDVLLDGLPDIAPGPGARYDAKESIELALITALQHLPPRQRAVLVPRDVLGYRAAEVVGMLDSTDASVKGALQPARAALQARMPTSRDRAPQPGSPASAASRAASPPPSSTDARGSTFGRRLHLGLPAELHQGPVREKPPGRRVTKVADSGSVWRAMAGSPVRFCVTSWPWRSLAYLFSTVVVAATVWLALLPVLLFPPALVLAGLPVGALERRRLALLKRVPVGCPHAAAPSGVLAWARHRLGERATWRELAYTVCLLSRLVVVDLLAIFGLFICLLFLALPLLLALDSFSVRLQLGSFIIDSMDKAWVASAGVGLPATIIAIYVLCVLASAQGAFAGWLLTRPDAELNRQVEELAESRIRLVDAFEVERRRIERDLHDGAQQHLVLLAMKLGLAQLELGDGNQRAGELVGEAHQQARQALAAIREQIHGIHPQVLADFGLSAAVGELAERCPIPVQLDMDVERRLPSAVESTAYFFVSEALTNAVRHAEAHRVTVSGRLADGRLQLVVTDDGRGGADFSGGSGLRGLADRAGVMDGTLKIISPEGGPTTLRMELPCRCG